MSPIPTTQSQLVSTWFSELIFLMPAARGREELPDSDHDLEDTNNQYVKPTISVSFPGFLDSFKKLGSLGTRCALESSRG